MGDAYKRQYTGSLMVGDMGCRLFCFKVMLEPMLTSRQLDHREQNFRNLCQTSPKNVFMNVICIMSVILFMPLKGGGGGGGGAAEWENPEFRNHAWSPIPRISMGEIRIPHCLYN